MLLKVQVGHQICLGAEFRDYVNKTYGAFLDLARHLSPSSRFLTDLENVAQLQDLYFLLEKGVLSVREERAVDGSSSLFLAIRSGGYIEE